MWRCMPDRVDGRRAGPGPPSGPNTARWLSYSASVPSERLKLRRYILRTTPKGREATEYCTWSATTLLTVPCDTSWRHAAVNMPADRYPAPDVRSAGATCTGWSLGSRRIPLALRTPRAPTGPHSVDAYEGRDARRGAM